MNRYSFFTLLLALALGACAGPEVVTTPQPETPPAPAMPDEPVAAGVPAMPEPPPAPLLVDPDTVQAGRYDQGRMWTFDNPPRDYLAETYGFRPDDGWFERARLGALRLPNCSASFVSPNGLILTNHHCARSSATQVTREGEDLGANGFYAATMDDERHVEDLHVDQLIEIVDVTDRLDAAVEGMETDAERINARQEAIAAIEAELATADDLTVEVISLYNGGQYSAYVFRRYDDLRLAFAPEDQAGFFGGDPDNFTYPRYSLDFALFRAYGVDFTLTQFLTSEAMVALNLLFYVALTLMLGVLFKSRGPLLAIALGSLLGGSLVPIAAIVQFTPWRLGDLVILPVLGMRLPPVAVTMLLSTAAWSVLFIAVAIWRFNRQEF